MLFVIDFFCFIITPMKEILKLKEVDSTNRYALDHFADLADSSLVMADSQSAGRGRRGKSWVSPPGINLYASYIVKEPRFPIGRSLWCGGLAALITLVEYTPETEIWLKWPNDVCCSSPGNSGFKKIAGLLAETWTPSASNRIAGVVVGIGINLNMSRQLLDKIDQPATSILAESGKEVNIAEFAEKLLENLTLMRKIAEDDPEKFFEIYSEANGLTGRKITIKTDPNSICTGTVKGVTEEGAILIEDENCEVRTIMTGDVNY
jgi:BirA family biotin operon repressor/biotin-[acetyl-CoA-carboxylase] ligase